MTQTDWEKGTLSSNATASEASPDWERGAISGPPQAPGLLRSAGDSAVALGSGITQGVKMLTDVAGADNVASRALGKATDALTDLSSPYAKAKKQERAEKIKAAEDSGSTWEEVKAYAGSFADAPLDTTLNALGTSAPTLAAGLLTGGGAVPAIAARAAQVGLGAAQGVGGIKGQIHDSVKQKHLDAGATEAEAAKRADAAQAYAGPNAGSIALGGVLGAAAGGTGAESAVRRLAGQRLAAEAAEKVAPGVVRSAVAGAAKEAPMEMLQGGQERHASNTALQGEGFDVPTWQGVAGQAALEGLASAPMGGGFGAVEGMAHKGATRRHGEGAAAFASGEARTPPDSIKSVVAKAQWVRGWDEAAANALKTAEDATGVAVAAAAQQPEAQAWTTSEGAAPAEAAESGTAVASPANAPNLDYETLPGAAPEAVGKEIPFEREFDTGGLSLQSTQPAAVPPVLDHDALRDKAGVMMPPQLDSGRIEVETGLQPLSNEQPPRQWDTGNLSLVGEGQPQAPLSQRMGLNPKAGALSKAAAMAVDSGASPVLQPQAAPVLEQQQAAPQVPAGVDPDTGEVSLQAQMDELKSRIAFMNQQGATQGWDGNRAAQRNALQTQLTRLELQAAGAQGRGASTAGAPAPVQLTGINQILAKQVPDMSEQELQQAIAYYGPNHKRTKKLEKALQALAQKTLTAIESGANGNVYQADQTQQGSAQPAQTGAAQAGQDAGQGVGNGTTPTANPGAQDQGASLAKAQAKVSEAAGAAQAALGKAAQIAREGNAEREAQRQRQLDASERWTRMTTVERQAVTATAAGLNPIARKNLHTRAWPDIGEKIRDKLLDSLVEPLASPASKAQDAAESVANAAPSAVSGEAPAKPAAQPVGDEKQFAAETGTLGIPRAEMPQVPTANHGGLVKHLKAQGIAHETTTVDAAQLKPTQAEYSPSKVEAAKSATGDRAVIVSRDGHIIDGHHQAVAAAEEGKQVKAIVLDAPVEQALAAVKASPSANAASVQEQPDSGDFPMSEAVQSYSGISHSGRSRADGDKQAFDKFMESARSAAEKLATTDAQRDALAAATESLRADYLKQYRSLMSVRAGAYSGFVAGRGNLNSKQANSRNSALDKAMERFDSWVGDNADRASKAVLAARTPEQVKADQDAVTAKIQEKADKKAADLKATLLKFLSFKSGDNMPYSKSAIITRVSYDRDGYPSSLTFKMADGSPVTDDKVELVPTLKDRDETLEQAKARIRSLVDEVRAENPELTKGIGAMRAAASAKVAKAAKESAPATAASSFLDRHNKIEDGISAGTLALDDYKSTFADLEASRDAVLSELQQLTKDKLLRAGGPAFAYRMGSEKKDAIVLAAYQKMLDTYALGRSYGPSSYFLSADSIAKNKADKAQALREMVGNTTAEDLAARAAEIKAMRDEFKAKRAAEADALANPKTLQDFRGFMSHWVDQGETSQAAYLRLTPEQRQQFDALEAAQTKDQREAEKRRARVTVQSAGNTTAGEIIATKHTKHGHDLFVVQLAERVERDAYDTLNSSAKRLGGSYSSYRGNGAVPGFQFRTREAAEAFQKLVAGDTAQAQDLANQRRDAFEDDKSQTTVERLRAMAEALDQGADEQLGADRKTNTARRARMANAAEDAARGSKAYAGTMRNLADAIEADKVQFLDGVRTKTQLSQLLQALGSAKVQQLMAKHGSWAAVEEHKHAPMDSQTVDFAEFPRFSMYRSDLAGLARQLLEIEGGKKMGAALARLADDVTDAYTSWAKDNLLSVSHFGNKTKGGFADYASKDLAERAIKRSGLVGKAVVLQIKRGQNRVILSPGEAMQQGLWQGDGDKRIQLGMPFVEDLAKLGKRKGSKVLALPWQLESTLEKRQRLQRMGIQTAAEFRSALRELQNLRQERAEPDRIKQLERSMVGRANDGLDFFPTGQAATEAAIDAAEIQPGMEVLEPHAGMAHIADAIREQIGVEPDVGELSNARRELLEAKGYNLVSSDFLELQGKQYDRIVMNPPFSDGRDIQHVQHAYGLLKPGGRLVAIVGEGAFFQSNKRAEGFREWLDERGATNEKLPDGSFMDPSLPVNTSVSARMVVIDKPATELVTDRDSTDTPSFRRQESEQLAGADFDVASFLQGMDAGQPAAAAVAQAPTTNVRPSYSPAARAEAVRAVKGTADAIRQAWANGPEVIVAFDMQDPVVPESARRADLKQRSGGARGAPEGFYYQGKVYLMASKLKTPNDAARVLFHEALGHHGLRGLFGKDLGLILNQVATMRKADVDAKIAEYGLRRVNRLDRRTAAEEVLAEMAQNTPQIGFVRRAVAAIRTWLRANVPGFKSLALTDAELIRNYILPARAWVERGTGAEMSQDIAFSRTSATSMPDAIIGSTLGSASSHPDYATAKGGDIEAAVRLAMDLVTPDLVAKVKAAIGDTKPLVVPVAAEEASGRNKIPRAAAEVLAHRLGLKAANGIVQANRARRTGMDGLDRIFAPLDFAGAVEAKPYLLVDDTLTQGGTFAALASHIREGGGTVAGVIALTGKQYSAKIQPSPETLASLRQKHGDLENEYRAATGYGFDALTESEARYLARYEPADRLRDRISDEGRRGREREDQSNSGQADPDADEGLRFSRSRLSEIRDSALEQLTNAFTHEGKVSLWDKSVGTMRHLAERAPSFKPVYESAQQNIDDVSMLANDAADMAPRILPRVESLGDLKKKPVSAADNKAVARPLFEGTLIWARDENGKPTLVDDLQKRYANLSAHNKAAMLLKHGKIDAGVLAMWQGLPVAQFEKLINARFENKMLKAGIVWTDAELQAQFGTDANQISLYRETRAAIDRSIDMTARTDMLRIVGEKYEPMRDAVLAQPSVEAAAQLLLDTLEQDAKADPDSRDRLAGYMQLINRRLETAVDLQQGGYAPLSRFGRYTVDVVDANGERLYFGMYETARESNRAKMQLAQEFKGATITTGTMSAEAYKLFAGVTPETLEQFGEMLGLKAEGNEAQDKAFQEFLKLTKNNHSAMKRLIHRKGIAGFSEDVGRVVANFVYSNARAGAMGLNAGKMETAIGKIPKEQGELKDLAMGLRDYIRDPQEEGQAVRGMLFAQYLGGSIASAFVNTTQPFAVTLPWLSQYGGMKKAGAQLARALKDMGTKGFKYESDLAKALQSAEDDGVVSPQEIHQLMAQARGAGMLRSGDGTKAGDLRAKAGNLWEQGKVLWGQPFALAEQFNRRSTFIASYRIAKEQGMADPAAFARKAVLETQFVYSKANKPKWARGAVGGTLFTFKTYSVSYLELMQRMWTQGGPEGKRAVGWALAMLLLMSGAGGVPFMEDAEDLIDGAGQMMGYNISAKQWRKELLANVVGKELGEFMEQGLSGLPGAPIDVSGRLGMGNLLPGTGLFLNKPNRERDLMEIVGPAGDLVARGFTGARKLLGGDVAGAALEISPTAVRNLAKGADMAATGMYRDTKGYKVIDTTLAEAAAKAIGFQPKSVAEVQEANSFMQRSKSFYTQTSSEIKAQWADALFRKDEAAVQRVRERLADWNRDNPEQPIVVKMPDVWKRVREMGKERSDRIADTAPKALRQQLREAAKGIN
ncbi:PLxRFG domain-containing protein [Comamonas sp. F1-6]|uniref:PLxRFG domain-containing protein n=1 Tax=Comamonas sp. F1-6 TaxID=673550 RepID=UPI0031D82127